jgi:hypothetical protein
LDNIPVVKTEVKPEIKPLSAMETNEPNPMTPLEPTASTIQKACDLFSSSSDSHGEDSSEKVKKEMQKIMADIEHGQAASGYGEEENME